MNNNINPNTSKHSHKLLVRVIEARDLPRADILSKSDPFVKLKVTGWHRSRKTSYQSVSFYLPFAKLIY